jgi:hypothetical protein
MVSLFVVAINKIRSTKKKMKMRKKHQASRWNDTFFFIIKRRISSFSFVLNNSKINLIYS